MERRKKYIVNPSYQSRYILLAIVPTVICAALVYSVMYYCIFSWIVIPEVFANNFLVPLKSANQILAVAIPVLLLFSIMWAVFASHRKVGPIVRIEKELDDILTTHTFTHHIKVRKNDEIKPLIGRLNKLIDYAQIQTHSQK